MINLLIAFDDADKNRGDYFNASHDYFRNSMSRNSHFLHLKSINTTECLALPIDEYIRGFNGNRFIFISYAHGCDDSIHIAGTDYIHSRNSYLFAETLFYACGCLAAINLGANLINHGCKVFIGYNGKISSLSPEAEPIYCECENSFINRFLTTDESIQQCLNYMYDTYSNRRKYLIENYGTFEASILEQNLQYFTVLCDEKDYDLTQSYFKL